MKLHKRPKSWDKKIFISEFLHWFNCESQIPEEILRSKKEAEVLTNKPEEKTHCNYQG